MLLLLAGLAAAGGIAAAGMNTFSLPAHPAPVRPEVRVAAGDAPTAISSGARAFGLIGDAVMGDGGRSFLLDVMERRVGVAEGGGSVAWTGSGGRGPGEFLVPVALALDADVLYVLDRGNRRIERYRTAGGRLQRYGDAVPLEFNPEDLCVADSRLYVLGAYRGHAIHEISPLDGRLVRSFAPDAQLADDLLATFRTGGYLACGTGGEIAFLPLLRPEVHRFSAVTGALLQSAALPGYNAVHVRRTADAVEFSAEGGSHDVAASVVPLSGGLLLVQVGRKRPGATTLHEFTAVRSYVVDWKDGGVRPVRDTLPRIADLREGWALALETDPEPSARRIRFTLPTLPSS
jgi:hypothetical protein